MSRGHRLTDGPQDEIRRHASSGLLDEVVMTKLDSFHLEQMDERAWWMGLTKGKKTLHIWIRSDKKGQLSVDVTEDEIGLPVVHSGIR